MIYLLLPILLLLGCEDKVPCGEDCNHIPPYAYSPTSRYEWVVVLNLDPIGNTNRGFVRGDHCVAPVANLLHLHDMVYLVHDVHLPGGSQCPNRAVVEWVE